MNQQSLSVARIKGEKYKRRARGLQLTGWEGDHLVPLRCQVGIGVGLQDVLGEDFRGRLLVFLQVSPV
jgi:hypothetical protein